MRIAAIADAVTVQRTKDIEITVAAFEKLV
jgi:hypothetical protein